MHKRVKTINKYYDNLEYDRNNQQKDALMKISVIIEELKFKETVNIANRFLHTTSLIENNLNYFMLICEHVDVVTTILDYLYYFGTICMLAPEKNIYYEQRILLLILTIYHIYKENSIQQFLETATIPESQKEMYYDYKQTMPDPVEIMIIFEDSDLYAVFNYLKLRRARSVLSKIWIEKSIKQIFMCHFKKCFGSSDISVHIFQSRQDLITPITSYTEMKSKINIASIWSEDVTAAKNLAGSLNHYIVFINTYMEICPKIMLPYLDVYFNIFLHYILIQTEYICTNPINPTVHQGLMYDLFYHGTWQKPKKNEYWIHNEILLANASRDDITECINSAVDGVKTWSSMSSKSRRKILANFANTLECNGKFLVANMILKWTKLSCIEEYKIKFFQTERFEVIETRKPQGIILLKEKDETTLFRELTQSLIIGNSVIVICDPDFCTLAPYCDFFKISGLPSGVINLLSSENAMNILCNDFANSESSPKFTLKQYIMMPCR